MAAGQHPFKDEKVMKAFFDVYRGYDDRLPATVWIFENNDNGNYVLCDKDMNFPAECLPAANLWKYSCPNPHKKESDLTGGVDSSAHESQVHFVSVHKKDIRKLLKYLLIVKHLRVEIFQYNKAFVKLMTSSPSDLSDVKHILFGEDGESEYSEILGIGPICSLHLAGDIRYVINKHYKSLSVFDWTLRTPSPL